MSIPGKKSKRGLFISFGISLAAVALVLFFTVDEDTVTSILRLKPAFLAAAFLTAPALWLVEGLRIKAIAWALGTQRRPGMRAAVRVYLSTFFFAGVTPLAIGEWPAQIYLLTRLGLAAGEAAAMALLRAFFTKCTFVFAAAVLLLQGNAWRGSQPLSVLSRYAFWVMTATTLLYILLMWQSELAVRLVDFFTRLPCVVRLTSCRPRLGRIPERALQETKRFRATVGHISRQSSLRLLLPLGLTVLYWGLYYAIAPLLLAGFGVRTDYAAAILRQVLIMLVQPFIPVPGGSGAVELGLATLFAAFVPAAVLGVFIVAWRFFTYYLPLLCGAFFALRGSGGR
ncbi:MAG: flippase-like domain-containing protein [Firmicutes bacterium]|nr:flippase-like domain-containing protein [Bacillota bacterium]